MKKIKILVADDHPAFREGLCRFLKEETDMDIIGATENGEDAVKLAQELRPDVAVMDVAMPRLNGIEATKQMIELNCKIAVLMVSAFGYESYLLAALRAGAKGYMLKSAPVNELVSAIRLVHAGQDVFDHKAISRVLGRLATGSGEEKIRLTDLQQRELEILKAAARGLSNRSIAEQLGISERTVQTHMVNIFRKLRVGSRTEAVLHAAREGWLTISDLQ